MQRCYTRYVKGVAFVNKRYTKGVPFLSEIVYTRVRVWSLPVLNVVAYPTGRVFKALFNERQNLGMCTEFISAPPLPCFLGSCIEIE